MEPVEKINRLQKLRSQINRANNSDAIWKMLVLLKKLQNSGGNAEETIDSLNLPFGMHLWVKGHFSELMELTEREACNV